MPNSLVYSSLGGHSATVQPDVDDPPAEVLVPGHHVHPVAHLYSRRTTKSIHQQRQSCPAGTELVRRLTPVGQRCRGAEEDSGLAELQQRVSPGAQIVTCRRGHTADQSAIADAGGPGLTDTYRARGRRRV